MMDQDSKFAKLSDTVCGHLASIQAALREFQSDGNGSAEPQEYAVSEQMQSLLSRVRAIEMEAQLSKERLDVERSKLESERHKSNHDELTGLPNRTAYNERAFHELRRYKRYHHPLSLAVIDVDFFKSVNDRFGHQAGDKALKLLARAISGKLRKVDFVARLGGEEFVVLLPETSGARALKVLEKVRESISRIPFRFQGEGFKITLSLGLTEFVTDDTMDSAFERADRALYAAKTEGRNRSKLEIPPNRPAPKAGGASGATTKVSNISFHRL